ncbi:hypothetical protein OJAV_G00071750 [Oryzias javanicus]|uniref:Uncharacterized protein n=1 Tax=Oryzias javanicus TaxID=123683 RepID=A0A437D942_ORYJA|nr:hypothetical protein OJAV_G00071750 [Oryzias javanicus]
MKKHLFSCLNERRRLPAVTSSERDSAFPGSQINNSASERLGPSTSRFGSDSRSSHTNRTCFAEQTLRRRGEDQPRSRGHTHLDLDPQGLPSVGAGQERQNGERRKKKK